MSDFQAHGPDEDFPEDINVRVARLREYDQRWAKIRRLERGLAMAQEQLKNVHDVGAWAALREDLIWLQDRISTLRKMQEKGP